MITGGLGGIGRAVCARFLREGATVFVSDLAEQGHLASPDSDSSKFIRLDVTSEEEVRGAMASVDAQCGKLDVLVNAAGIEIEKTIEDTSLEEWNRSFAVNVTGTFLTSKFALPLLRNAARNGSSASIINFGSYDGFIADPGLAAYCATKGAVHALTRAMACDHGPEGIRVNAICPGYIDTPMLQSFFTGEGSGGGGANIETLQTGSARHSSNADLRNARRHRQPSETGWPSDEARYASGQLWVMGRWSVRTSSTNEALTMAKSIAIILGAGMSEVPWTL